jgi:glucose-6-phosphate 1-dehydrogenase
MAHGSYNPPNASGRRAVPADPTLFVIFGATGDLARRKLIPALRELTRNGSLGKFHILGVARETWDDQRFRQLVAERLEELGAGEADTSDLRHWCGECLFYQPLPNDEPAAFTALRHRIEAIEGEQRLPGNRAFYLALPPAAFPVISRGLGNSGLARSPGWTRLVVEKPFGTDLGSARELNRVLHLDFEESQIYRIDHYLGKEAVQNLLAFRFANPLFEQSWNRDRVERVEITVAETLGVGRRAGYFERAGALRDMVQNHITQVLCFVAMEVPAAFQAADIRVEKLKVLRSILPLGVRDALYGQYRQGLVAGEQVDGYLEEEGVAAGSTTPTFVALRLQPSNWRWQGVPFYIRSGKRLARRVSEIAIVFRRPPAHLFKPHPEPGFDRDVLRIRLQPDEAFQLEFDVKVPGEGYRLAKQQLGFRYAQAYRDLPEAYETLLLDVVQGDATLFVHADEVEASWALYQPLLDDPPPIEPYPAGSWGPEGSRRILKRWRSGGEVEPGTSTLEPL